MVKDSDDEDDSVYIVQVPEEQTGNEIKTMDDEGELAPEIFTDEEYLITSPVVLGFSFGHKMWMEFDIAGLNEIQWNEGAFDSLVIPHDQKDVVKALVESRSYSASKNIDDVIQGMAHLSSYLLQLHKQISQKAHFANHHSAWLNRQRTRSRCRPPRPPRHWQDPHR